MLLIHYPEPAFTVKQEDGRDLIFDPLRRKWLQLTPEEWVRQNFVQFLIQVKQYPATLIAMEKMIRVGEMNKRFDILVYDRSHQPWMMIECKAAAITLNDAVIAQLLRYHITVPATYLVVTNGDKAYAWQKIAGKFETISELPAFE